jgi:hypothetical protein
MHVGELGAAQGLAGPARHRDGIEHVGESDGAAVGHVGVPVLAGVGEAERPAVAGDVGEDHHLRMLVVLERGADDVDLELAEAAAEGLERGGVEPLAWEAQDAVAAERAENDAEVPLAQRLRQVEAFDRRPERWSGGFDLDHWGLPGDLAIGRE